MKVYRNDAVNVRHCPWPSQDVQLRIARPLVSTGEDSPDAYRLVPMHPDHLPS